MFQFTGFATYSSVFSACGQVFNLPGCPIRKSSDQWFLAPPRSLSQLGTSFIAYPCQGIHRVPLATYTFAFLSPPFLGLARQVGLSREMLLLGDASLPINRDDASRIALHQVKEQVSLQYFGLQISA